MTTEPDTGLHPVAPDGWSFPQIVSIRGGSGAGWAADKDLVMGASVNTGSTVHPGDRIVLSCRADDPHGRELRWWVHPFNRPRGGEVCGSTVELTWLVHSASVGERVYLGIGMAAQSHYHRDGGRDEQGYDGWLVCYYRVAADPAGVRGHAIPEQRQHDGREGSWTERSDTGPSLGVGLQPLLPHIPHFPVGRAPWSAAAPTSERSTFRGRTARPSLDCAGFATVGGRSVAGRPN